MNKHSPSQKANILFMVFKFIYREKETQNSTHNNERKQSWKAYWSWLKVLPWNNQSTVILVNNRQIDQRYRIRSKGTDLYEQLADLWQKDNSIRLKQKKILCLNNWISLFKKENYTGVDLSVFTKHNLKWITDLVVLNFRCQIDYTKNQILRVTDFPTMKSIESEWIKLGKSSLYVGQSNAINWESSENKKQKTNLPVFPKKTTCSGILGFWAI